MNNNSKHTKTNFQRYHKVDNQEYVMKEVVIL